MHYSTVTKKKARFILPFYHPFFLTMKPLSACLSSSLLFLGAQKNPQAFFLASPGFQGHTRPSSLKSASSRPGEESASSVDHASAPNCERRLALARLVSGAATGAVAAAGLTYAPFQAAAEESIFAPKFVQEYPDFTMTDEGWSYLDVKVGNGESPKKGDRVIYEWSGYTIGYFGRPFEAKGYDHVLVGHGWKLYYK